MNPAVDRPRVAVTTAADRAGALADSLAAAGLEPVILSCISIEPATEEALESARRSCADAGLIVLTSSRPLQLLWPDGPLPAVPFAVVGAASAGAVVARRGEVLVTGSGTAADLIAELQELVAGRRVAFPHAAGTAAATLQQLDQAAASLAAHPVYATIPVAPGTAEVDAVAFVSPSSVAGWQLSRRLEGVVIGAIGPTTAAALRRHGHPVHVLAPTPAYGSLAGALADYMKEAA